MPFFSAPSGTRVVDYSHSSVFTSSYTTPPPTLSLQAPPLTTIYTAPSSCSNRWMMNATLTASQAFSRGLPDTIDDPQYQTCQPFAVAPTYSPGVCPDGHTIAEVTEHQVSRTAGAIDRYWQASCCTSGLGFGTATKGLCYSSVTAPLAVRGLVTGVNKANGMTITAYEFNNNGSTVRNMQIMTAGLAIADPIIVGWQIRDLESFPREYASSLAKVMGVSAQETSVLASASTASLSPSQPVAQKTSSPPQPPTSALSSGAKAGIVVGVLFNIVVFCTIIIFVLMRRARKKHASPSSGGGKILEVPWGGGETSETSFPSSTLSEQISLTTVPRQEMDVDKELQELGSETEIRNGSELDSKAIRVLSRTPVELDASNQDHISRSQQSAAS